MKNKIHPADAERAQLRTLWLAVVAFCVAVAALVPVFARFFK